MEFSTSARLESPSFTHMTGRLQSQFARFWSVAHDIVINSQRKYATGVPPACILLLLVARTAVEVPLIAKILSEFNL